MEKDNSESFQPPFFFSKEQYNSFSELEKAEVNNIADSIMKAFDRYGQRYLERLFGGMDRASPGWKSELNEFAGQIGLLLSKRACIPGFYLYVLKEVTTDKKLKRQRPTLVKAFLLSMLKQDGVKISELIEKPLTVPEEGDFELYTRRTVQQIMHDNVCDAFYEIQESRSRRKEDSRVKSFTSIFGIEELPVNAYSENVTDFLALEGKAWGSNNAAKEMISFNAKINPVMPEYVQDMISFKEECRKIILKENFLVREKYSKYFCNDEGDFTLLFEVFYRQVSSILAQEWFRDQSPTIRKTLIERGYPFRLTKEDASQIKDLLLKLNGREEWVKSLLASCAIVFQNRGFFNESIILYKELLNSINLSIDEKARVLEDIAIVYRKNKKFKLMVSYMKKALNQYRVTGEQYRVCVALKNIGEAEWNMGFKEKANNFFKQAEELGENLPDQGDRFGVLWNLASAFKRIGDVKVERNFLSKCLVALSDDETDKILQIEARLHQLDRFSFR